MVNFSKFDTVINYSSKEERKICVLHMRLRTLCVKSMSKFTILYKICPLIKIRCAKCHNLLRSMKSIRSWLKASFRKLIHVNFSHLFFSKCCKNTRESWDVNNSYEKYQMYSTICLTDKHISPKNKLRLRYDVDHSTLLWPLAQNASCKNELN